MISILIGFLLTVHVITSIFLLLIVLMQRPRSEGLGTAFGGGVTDTLFGSGAGNVLTKITTWLGIIFFLTTISLAYLYSRQNESSEGLGSKLKNAPQAVSPAPAAVTNAVSASTANVPVQVTPEPSKASAPVSDSHKK